MLCVIVDGDVTVTNALEYGLGLVAADTIKFLRLPNSMHWCVLKMTRNKHTGSVLTAGLLVYSVHNLKSLE